MYIAVSADEAWERLPASRWKPPGRASSGSRCKTYAAALELTLGRRQELPIHTAHTAGLTRLFRDATYTIDVRDDAASGLCFHCDGSGLARSLWKPAPGEA
ncbi:hypothetical protein [Streptomyces sp. NBC_00690]|uniref:hypothetical protein n=1 Tax=Streptomyces sp. NBC_00690 TaxID=2975808 RepID=UPI002E2B8872|nr:hypothetical protein [Streptomyces sp. NBC_00690]